MRGKLELFGNSDRFNRITPADAGKTGLLFAEAYRDAGSPPRMRGKHYAQEVANVMGRITPADAGKTVVYFQKMLAI